MSELYFRAGETEGFTSKKLADKKEGYANPIRELLQNSLDASKEAKNDKCEINIYIEQIDKKDIPHIGDYENILNQAIQYHSHGGSYGRNAKQTVDFIKEALKEDKLDILMFVDNGRGMSPKILNGLIGERSVKSNESSGGSFGVGHLSSYFLSSLRYVLYASKYKKNGSIKTLYSGSPILAGYEDKDEIPRGSVGRILEQIPDNELKPTYAFPEIFPNFMQSKMDEVETGSMVTILGLNSNWNKEADYAIVSNFFYAIKNKQLIVNIHNNNILISIDESGIEKILEKNKDGKMATGDKILANQYIYQSWLTVKDSDLKKYIELGNGDDKVCVYIRNNIETDSVIALVRNGMLIARHDKMLSNDLNNLRHSENFEPFSVVINVDETECPTLFTLVKGAENPYHNKLVKRLLPKEEKRLKALLKELSEKIKEYLKERDREGFNLSIPLLEIPNKAEAQGSNANRPQSQTSKAKPNPNPNPNPPKQPIDKIKPTNKGKKRQAPVVVSRALVSKNAVRLKDNGDTFDVELSVTPSKIGEKDIVYLSMSLAQDSDNNEVGSGLDFINLSIDGNAIEIPDFIETNKDGVIEKEEADKSQIKLGKLSVEQTYDIKATIKKPKTIKDVGVSLRPFLGLRQRK